MKACPVSEPPFSASALGWQEAETTLPVGSGLGLFILHTPRLGKPTNSGFLGSPWPAGVRGLLEALTGPTTELFIGTTVLSSQRGEPSWTTDLNTAKSKETKAQSHIATPNNPALKAWITVRQEFSYTQRKSRTAEKQTRSFQMPPPDPQEQ